MPKKKLGAPDKEELMHAAKAGSLIERSTQAVSVPRATYHPERIRFRGLKASAPMTYAFKNKERSLEGVHELYDTVIPAVALKACLDPVESTGPFVAESAAAHIADVLKQMEPRDPIEGMLIQQLVITHARILSLSFEVANQIEAEVFRIMNDALIATSNLFRRQILALQTYRVGPGLARTKPGTQSFTADKMQVLQNFGEQIVKLEDEQDADSTNLSSVSERPAIEATAGSGASPVTEINRGK